MNPYKRFWVIVLISRNIVPVSLIFLVCLFRDDSTAPKSNSACFGSKTRTGYIHSRSGLVTTTHTNSCHNTMSIIASLGVWVSLLIFSSGFPLFSSPLHMIRPFPRPRAMYPLFSTARLYSLDTRGEPVWLDEQLSMGRCVGVCLPQPISSVQVHQDPHHWAHDCFHPDEIQYASQLPPGKDSSFWLGRLALRHALDFPDYPILKDSHGRPNLPLGVFASISHKQNHAIALISSDTSIAGIGVDLESSLPRKRPRSIATRVLTVEEQEALGSLTGISRDEEVLLRFSLKEAVYKAIHPVVNRYVGFQQVEVQPFNDGTATCCWNFPSIWIPSSCSSLEIRLQWRQQDSFFLTAATSQC
eukprot:Nitzschia sp. Nitz4//scaffold58_size112336//99354//100497//NITZ4_004050-RA/size112336-augustus-gene-0.25-mRNA-1//-1//CDS//3329555040//4675//frame0